MRKVLILILATTASLCLTGCGQQQRYAQCVNQQNQIIDPAQCQQLQVQAAQHQNDNNWLTNFLIYHWVFGGFSNDMYYVGGQGYPVTQALPGGYAAYPQSRYVNYIEQQTHTTPSTVPAPTKSALSKATAASKAASTKTGFVADKVVQVELRVEAGHAFVQEQLLVIDEIQQQLIEQQ